MEIFLDNIGLIQKSTVKLDGLTVIAGENNSGKSTVGKVLYAITDGMIDIDYKQERDEISFCRHHLFTKLKGSIKTLFQPEDDSAHGFDIFRHGFAKEYSPVITAILSRNNDTYFESKHDFILFLEDLINEISQLQFDNIDLSSEKKTALQVIKSKTLEGCNAIKDFLLAGAKVHDFRAMYMNFALGNEFEGEIQPVKNTEIISKICFKKNENTVFECEIEKNNILLDNFKANSYDFSKSFFIDNAFVLDEINSNSAVKIKSNFFNEDRLVVDKTLIFTHKEKLIDYLERHPTPNITHILDKAKLYSKIKEKIDLIIPGELKRTPQGLKYEHDGTSLKAVNLATGSKMFAIIKMILDKYDFDDSTMLILDEPEAHLHPKWQNAFAEVIVLLVKELGVRVLLTSHSAHFVLALDAQMRQYEINDKTNFYKTCIQEDGFVHYELVNDDLTVIYDDFATYYAVSKYIRDSKYYGENE